LYDIVLHKDDTIAKVMESSPPNMTFRWDLVGPRLNSWNFLLQRLASVQLTLGNDEFRWNLHESGKFLVVSIYNVLIQLDLPVVNNKKISKMKIPLKSKFFVWYLRRGVILTKDNLIKRNWHGNKAYVFSLMMRQLITCFSNIISRVIYE
jgi:hypothetical protein